MMEAQMEIQPLVVLSPEVSKPVQKNRNNAGRKLGPAFAKPHMDLLNDLVAKHGIKAVSQILEVSHQTVRRVLAEGRASKVFFTKISSRLDRLLAPPPTYSQILAARLPALKLPAPKAKAASSAEAPVISAAPCSTPSNPLQDFKLPDEVLLGLARESLRSGKPCMEILIESLYQGFTKP